jgi:hypothetical protein
VAEVKALEVIQTAGGQLTRFGEWGMYVEESKDRGSFKIWIFRVEDGVILVSGGGTLIRFPSPKQLTIHPPTMRVDRAFLKTLVDAMAENHSVYQDRFLKHLAACTMIHPHVKLDTPAPAADSGVEIVGQTIGFLREELARAEEDAAALAAAATQHEREAMRSYQETQDAHYKRCDLCRALAGHRKRKPE